ncbi:hypothetical protein THAOC_32063, partial [Thalassiosira oceanica]
MGLDSNNVPLAVIAMTDSDEERSAPAEESRSPKAMRVEVCLGPDCQGGRRTLLEIEELVSSRTSRASKPCEVTVGSTGCRDFCTVGPNVYVKSDVEDDHFTRVGSPQACRRVVSSILADDTSDDALSSTQALLRRREDGIRWRRHKERVCREKRLGVLKRKVK